MRSAVDTSIISALWSKRPAASLASGLLAHAESVGGLVICGVVYAELIVHPKATLEFVEAFISRTGLVVEFNLDDRIWRDAARGFKAYAERRRESQGGEPKRLLADFLVASHAQWRADRLLTLDRARYERDFSKLRIEPSSAAVTLP